MSLRRKIDVKRLGWLVRIPKEDGNISPLLRGSQGSLSNATKPNVTQSAVDLQDLRTFLNSKRREAVKRQRAETADPLTESKLKLTKTTPTVAGLDATPKVVAAVAGQKEDLRSLLDSKKRMRETHAVVPKVRTTSKFKQGKAVTFPSHSRQKTTSPPSSAGCERTSGKIELIVSNTSNQLLLVKNCCYPLLIK